ncbi:GNAT family N-acetyltransferase [Muriicola marianensis]|uniref:N-acetyltransferase n=1 Tax=Muriicola marianensis TaxID=1324801 RepID=A0ABQ1QQB3_9FLAO|nr:GNAT family N-acetyltransferase [Muriicola marianensis]GGD40623.1 N-acetyltransferase [Muriicola marianensis]
MKGLAGDIPIVKNKVGNQHRFELRLDEGTAYVEYLLNQQGTIYLTHTEVPASLEGRGVGSALVNKVLDHIRNEGLKMAPLCPFIAAFLKRHPKKAEGLLAPGFQIGS